MSIPRSWVIVRIVVAAILFLGASHSDAAGQTSKLRADDRIVFVGDSITGQGWNNGGGFIHLIEKSRSCTKES